MKVKEIFLEAAKLMESGHSRWMCNCIKHILEPNRAVCYVEVPENFTDYGFTKENYIEFIKKNYPELEKYIFYENGSDFNSSWIQSMCMDDSDLELVIKSKVEFLKSLAK